MQSQSAARLQVLAAAALFATGGAVVKASSLGAAEIAGLRSGIAAVFLLAVVPAARRRWTARMVMVAAFQAATFILFVHANRLTTAANTIFLQSTAPLWVLTLSPWLLGERLSRRDLPFVVAMAAGALPFLIGLQEPQATAPDPGRGDILAALSGLTWALTLMGLRWLRLREVTSGESGGREPEGGAIATVACANVLVFLWCLPGMRDLDPGMVRGAELVIVAYLGIVQIGVAYVLLTRGLDRVRAFEASLFVLLEPVLSVLLTFAVHAETPSVWSLFGGVVILAATTWKAVTDSRRSERPPAG